MNARLKKLEKAVNIEASKGQIQSIDPRDTLFFFKSKEKPECYFLEDDPAKLYTEKEISTIKGRFVYFAVETENGGE